MRTLVLVDGEHYPPVVRAAIERLPSLIPGCRVVGAAFLGGAEKLADDGRPDLGLEIVGGDGLEAALAEGLARFRPELVVDLSDQPVVDSRSRMRLATRALLAGAAYQGADFRFEPPPRPRLVTKPSVAIVGTGKRTGKTAVSGHLARLLAAQGTPPVIVAMSRGGPPEPELVDPDTFDLTPEGLVKLAQSGRHAASDHLEDALVARVAAVGTRRCGGGLAGATVDDTFADGVAIANDRPEELVILEGSGQAIPPAHADATLCVVPAPALADQELLRGYLGSYRLLLADLIVVTMAETALAVSGTGASIEAEVRRLAPGVRVVVTVFRPTPLLPISGRKVLYASTAPAAAVAKLAEHLEREHDCNVVGASPHLADRRLLAEDLEAAEDAEVLVVELKAAAVDLAARVALERGMQVVFCDNRAVSIGGDGTFEESALDTAELARRRFTDHEKA